MSLLAWRNAAPKIAQGAGRWDQTTGKILLPQGKVGNDSGVIAYTDIGASGRDSAHLRYRVEFDPAFPFYESGQLVNQALSGKLPGVCGGENIGFTPTYKPDGFNGFSIRPVFITGGDVWLYLYDLKSGDYARTSPRASGVFLPGQTHTLEMQVVLNTPGADDGAARLWIDGALVSELTDLYARIDPKMAIDGSFWCVFFGGASAAHAPPWDTWVRIDPAEVKASEGYIGV